MKYMSFPIDLSVLTRRLYSEVAMWIGIKKKFQTDRNDFEEDVLRIQ